MTIQETSDWIEAAAAERKMEKLRWLIPQLILEVQAAMPCYCEWMVSDDGGHASLHDVPECHDEITYKSGYLSPVFHCPSCTAREKLKVPA